MPGVGRNLQDLIGFLSEIHAAGVDLFLHQQGLDTTTPAGRALFQMMGVFVVCSMRARGAANPLLSALMIHYSAKASRVPERRIRTSGFAVI